MSFCVITHLIGQNDRAVCTKQGGHRNAMPTVNALPSLIARVGVAGHGRWQGDKGQHNWRANESMPFCAGAGAIATICVSSCMQRTRIVCVSQLKSLVVFFETNKFLVKIRP